jgi:DNA-binding CsgD family transcriptional regulator/tetratricopeptide (TPR) repeat protein
MLLERDAYLRELDAALKETTAGSGCLALVSGEAGIGKTALVERFTHNHAREARLLWGACDALVTPRPLGPLYDIAAQLPGDLLARLISEPNRAALFSTVLVELQRTTSLVVIEDAHWADEATLDLVKFIGRRIQRTRALLILTFRDDELGPRHPLRIVLGDLATSTAARRLALRPLSAESVRVLIGDRPLDAAALHHRTGGNPFFITEVLSSALGGLPATVRDAVLARVARLSLPAQAVLQAAAVIGPRIEPELLTEVSRASAQAVEECLAMGMLVAAGEALAFRHELARQTVLETISPPHKLALHRMTLAALSRSPVTRTNLTRLALQAEAAGDRDALREYAPAAARQAAAAGAHREAVALFGLALRSAEDIPLNERGLWLEEYAAEMHTIGALEDCAAIRRQAIATWRTAGDRRREGLNLARQAVVLINVGQPVEAQRASHLALELLQELPPGPELALAQRTQAHLLFLNRDCAEAIAWGNQAIELAERFNDRETLARAYTTVGAAWLLTDYQRGRHYLEKCVAIAEEIGWEFGAANAYANLGMLSCEVFRLPHAVAFLRDGLAYTGERDLDFLGKYMLAWQALTFMYLGRWEQALQIASEALQGFGLTVIGRIPALTALGRLRARRGEADPLAPLAEALELALQSQTLPRLGLVLTARAEAAWLAGDRARTLAESRALYDLAVSKRHPWIAGELAFWRWRGGDDVQPLPAWMAKPYALHIAGDWRAAAAAWQQLGCPYEQARALADGDADAQIAALEILDRLGARSAADDLRQRMRAAGLTNVPRGPRPATRENPFGLTARQLDILALLAYDLTNAEIAARLHLSPKTVDHHVSAVLAKLSVRSREQAAAIARQHPNFGQAR